MNHEKWIKAQEHEKNHHDFSFSERNFNHYKGIYGTIFKRLNKSFELDNKSILEIGHGVFGCLLFCSNFNKSYIVEPMIIPDKIKSKYQNNIEFIQKPFTKELTEIDEVDESFLFNVLQHVENSDEIIDKLKSISKKIYFFEPINTELNTEHINSFNIEYFEKHFGIENTKKYIGKSEPEFHTNDCAYGEWKKE